MREARAKEHLEWLRGIYWDELCDAISETHDYPYLKSTSEVMKQLTGRQWAAAEVVARIDTRVEGRSHSTGETVYRAIEHVKQEFEGRRLVPKAQPRNPITDELWDIQRSLGWREPAVSA